MPAQLLNRRKLKSGRLVSPLLSLITKRTRTRLRRKGVDVDRLEDESRELYCALDKWWKLPPAPPKPDDKRSAFWRRLDTADALLLEHHRKVREPGERLDDPIGQGLVHCICDSYISRYTLFFVRVTPADRCGRLVIVADESHDLACQIVDRAKDAASYDLTLNF